MERNHLSNLTVSLTARISAAPMTCLSFQANKKNTLMFSLIKRGSWNEREAAENLVE